MDGERIPSRYVKQTGICPLCVANLAPPVSYGQFEQRALPAPDPSRKSPLTEHFCFP